MNKTVGIIGTGRMGVHLAATWANAGFKVILGSRNKEKAESIVNSILSGQGYVGSQGENVPPFQVSDGFSLQAGSTEEAAIIADVLVFVTPFPQTATIIDNIKDIVKGKGKILIDMTNPWYSGHGLPTSGPQSAVQIHKALLDDDTASWAIAYKNILWRKILPGSKGVSVDICGDMEAKEVISALITSHGFVVVDNGDIDVAPSLEPGRGK